MTVLIEDAKKQLSETFGDILSSTLPFHELLYADDTLLIDVSGENLEKFMTIVAKLGSEYGLKLNWKKVEYLPVRCFAEIHDENGKILQNKDSFLYLGAQISSDGRIDAELSRRLGLALADFRSLCRIWNHTNLSKAWKLKIFSSCIWSKLMYGLQTAWLSK